jgi:hypothetical protein
VGVLDALSEVERRELERMGAVALFPLLVGRELFGFVLLGHEDQTVSSDRSVHDCDPVRISAVADQLARAMARLPELQPPADRGASWRMSLRLELV